MILCHPCEAEEPVGDSHVAIHDDAHIPPFDPEGGWEVRQALLPDAPPGIRAAGLERRFTIEMTASAA